MAPTMLAEITHPASPAHVLLGLIPGANLGPPISRPRA